MRKVLRVGFVIGSLLSGACGEQDGVPIAPSNTVVVQPFISGTPKLFAGAVLPLYAGTWEGTYRFVACRASVYAACKMPPSSPQAPMRMALTQDGPTLDGTVNFSGRGSFFGTYAFAGYVADSPGIAGTASLVDANGLTQRIIVRLEVAEDGFRGALYTETYGGGGVAPGGLYATRKYEIVSPLRREE